MTHIVKQCCLFQSHILFMATGERLPDGKEPFFKNKQKKKIHDDRHTCSHMLLICLENGAIAENTQNKIYI